MRLHRLAALPLAALLALGCAPKKAGVHEVADEELVPGLVDLEMRGFSPKNRAVAAALGEVLFERETDEDDTDLFLPRETYAEHLFVLKTDPSRVREALAALRGRPDVVWAEPVVRMRALWTPDDPDFPKQWHLRAAGAPQAWEAARGEGVTVAVIDTGVAPVDDLVAGKLLKGFNFLTNQPGGLDDHGHGTHVAGTIAQATGNGKGTAGMAPGARILPLKVLSAFGSGDSAGISLAIRAAADQGARVINLSLGGGGRSESMAAAVAYARRKGVFVAAAAGNSGGRGVSYPAAYAGSFAVSAVGPQGRLAPYSSWGPEVKLAGPGGDKAQGEEKGVLQQTIAPEEGKGPPEGAFRWFQGTSMATPHVAGAAALLYSVGVTSPAAVERLLTSTAASPGSWGSGGPPEPAGPKAELYGAGLLDAGAAVKQATLWWGLWRLAIAAAGAFLALAQARRMGQVRPHDRLGAAFWGPLAFGAGALAVLAPLGLARLPLLGALVLPPAGMAARWLGLPGTSLLATVAAYVGWSALLPMIFALVARKSSARPTGNAAGLAAAGFAFGMAGLFVHAALVRSVHLPWMPSALVPFWLGLSALVCWGAGRGLLARETLR